ncbi:2,3-butanediol dehydrogenase [Gordonia sp. TBRC 11910]|uniref:2,3-butanediol dehydrogenase n=1 Tax=Gordonia asplenii TaxID=2725283 RepID=A0A848KXZ9_9ACTN|nr:2,3-butanediol dehydrogenase [Gordonia asplenii]NMO03530.1 2,3-butanediol dehydrogenase [Gordonia asplenii]
MKAARLHGQQDVRIEDVPEPTPGPGQVKIRNAYAGICGSDLHFYFALDSVPYDLTTPHPLTGARLPQILGHEFSGTIVEVGEGVNGLSVGDRGAVHPTFATCGKCPACLRGVPMTCPLMGALGATAIGGGLSEYVVANAEQFHKLPDDVDLLTGALVEPMSVAWHGVARSGVQPGGTALVAGAGPIGIGAWFALKARGVDKVLVSEPSAQRREVMASLGATVVDPVGGDLSAAVAALTDGGGLDVVIEAAGAGAALESGISSLAPNGRVVVVSLHEHPTHLNPTELMMTQKEIVGAVGYGHDEFDAVIAAMSDGLYDTTGWVQERDLDDIVDALHQLRTGTGSKVLLRVS